MTHTRRTRGLTLALTLSALLTACMGLPDAYFKDNVGKATQDEVTARLGSPDHRYPMDNGESKWIYIIHVSTATYLTYANTDAEVCYNYELIFDANNVLKSWAGNNKACGAIN
ncbi:MAG: hypothetical protein ACKOCD_08670 [Nitrospiraceae bacterium]